MGDTDEGDDTTSAVGKGDDDSSAAEEEEAEGVIVVVVDNLVVDDDDEENVGLDDETTSLLERYVGEYVKSVGVACVVGLGSVGLVEETSWLEAFVGT